MVYDDNERDEDVGKGTWVGDVRKEVAVSRTEHLGGLAPVGRGVRKNRT
jgi:hypothetical protein